MIADRQARLETVKALVRKSYGDGAIFHASERVASNIEVIPTGSIAIDAALGVGGMPRGRVIEIYGPESSGKTTVALHVLAEAQRLGGVAAIVDAEHALDLRYAQALGVDLNSLLVAQPDCAEEALDIVEKLVASGAVDAVAIDSVAALVPKAEIQGEMGDAFVGLQARLMSQAMRKLTGIIARTRTVCIFINQLREKVGVMFGNPETTPGGRALKFYATVRLEVRRVETLKEGSDVVGSRTRIKVVKNKVAPPFREAVVDILYGKGVSREGSLLDLGSELNPPVVQKSGAWFSYGDLRLGQGREQARRFLQEHPEVAAEIDAAIRARLQLSAPPEPAAPEPAAPAAEPASGRSSSTTRRRSAAPSESGE